MSDINATFDVKVSANNLKVTGTYLPAQGNGKSLSEDQVLSVLKSQGITIGIDKDVISYICKSEKPLMNIVIATALLPEVGEKASIKPYFDLNHIRKAVEKEDGSVDFHDLGEICSATKGQELYRKIPPKIGKSGLNVYGNEIPGIPGRDLKIVLGSGTELDENDPHLVKASCDGEIIIKNGIITITPVHNINGDVDYSTGNVKFNGSIKIKGTVKSGFRVEGRGDIEIYGNVEDAVVVGENDIIIMGGCVGSGDGSVRAGRDVTVKFVENQSIEAGRDIIIYGEAYHSRLLAGRSIISKGRKSLIVGGQSEAKISIEAMRFGSVAAALTIIKVGVDPKIAEHIKNIEDEIKQTNESHAKLEKSIIFLYRQKIDNNGQLPPSKRALLEKLEEAREAIPEKLNMLQAKLDNLIKEQKKVDKAYASADIAVYPKVRVYIGTQYLTVEDTLGPTIFKMSKSEVIGLSK